MLQVATALFALVIHTALSTPAQAAQASNGPG